MKHKLHGASVGASYFKFLVVLIVGLVLGVALTQFFSGSTDERKASSAPKPLYWVAPMDSDFRRDEPGLSPMGMELIPVYADEPSSNDAGPGTISISPNVSNNIGVRTTKAERKVLRREIQTVGYVQYDEDKLIHIHPRISGWIEKLYVKASGDPVELGAPLYALYSPELVNVQEELLIALKRNDLRLVRATENRLQALHIPKSFILQLKKSQEIQQSITFFAPQAGVVDMLSIREGFYVQPGTTLLSIAALDTVWIEAEISERLSPEVKANDSVTVSLDFLPAKKWLGKINYLYPSLDAETRSVRARIRLQNPERILKPNMFATVNIHLLSSEPQILIRREALIRTGRQDRVVLALGEGSFKSIEVKAGRMSNDFVEILSGLAEGESVVSSAQFLLDSESSKHSDFKRLHHSEMKVQSAEVQGTVNSVDKVERIINISRGPIEKWQRAAATMNFSVEDYIDLAEIKNGAAIDFSFEIRGDEFIVTEIRLVEPVHTAMPMRNEG